MTDEEKIKRLATGCRLLIKAMRSAITLIKPSPSRDEISGLLGEIEAEIDMLTPKKPVHPTVKRLFGGSH